VCDILCSPEYDKLTERLRRTINRLREGIRSLGFPVLEGVSPILAVPIGDIENTLIAGKWLFDRGFYVQSAVYPAVPINGGLLRILVNANHSSAAVDGLLNAFSDLRVELSRSQRGFDGAG
jgi:7-keto-8-aminopelargonate synthetase-like enzyme